MTVIDFNTDSGKVAIILLLQKIKIIKPEIGAYIEHFFSNEQDIIIKLTNVFLKVKAYMLNNVAKHNNDFCSQDLEKVATTFVKIVF